MRQWWQEACRQCKVLVLPAVQSWCTCCQSCRTSTGGRCAQQHAFSNLELMGWKQGKIVQRHALEFELHPPCCSSHLSTLVLRSGHCFPHCHALHDMYPDHTHIHPSCRATHLSTLSRAQVTLAMAADFVMIVIGTLGETIMTPPIAMSCTLFTAAVFPYVMNSMWTMFDAAIAQVWGSGERGVERSGKAPTPPWFTVVVFPFVMNSMWTMCDTAIVQFWGSVEGVWKEVWKAGGLRIPCLQRCCSFPLGTACGQCLAWQSCRCGNFPSVDKCVEAGVECVTRDWEAGVQG